MRLQSIRGIDVLNYTSLGKSIARFRKANTDFMIEQIDVGFMDGGCLAFALSIKSLFSLVVPNVNTRIVSVGRTTADHAVLEVIHPELGTVYLDADGMATGDEVCSKMVKIEGLSSANIYEFNYNQDEVISYEEIGLPAQLFKKLGSSDVSLEIVSAFRTSQCETLFEAVQAVNSMTQNSHNMKL